MVLGRAVPQGGGDLAGRSQVVADVKVYVWVTFARFADLAFDGIEEPALEEQVWVDNDGPVGVFAGDLIEDLGESWFSHGVESGYDMCAGEPESGDFAEQHHVAAGARIVAAASHHHQSEIIGGFGSGA